MESSKEHQEVIAGAANQTVLPQVRRIEPAATGSGSAVAAEDTRQRGTFVSEAPSASPSEACGAVGTPNLPRRTPELPPAVYVPCEPMTDVDVPFIPDVRNTTNGRKALLVYSAVDRMRACCGWYQAAALVTHDQLEAIQHAIGFEVLMLDVPIPPQHRRTKETLL